jgi:hypothetical protein
VPAYVFLFLYNFFSSLQLGVKILIVHILSTVGHKREKQAPEWHSKRGLQHALLFPHLINYALVKIGKRMR